MAEYCKSCAKKYGFKDDKPTICEGCGRVFKRKNILQKLILSFK